MRNQQSSHVLIVGGDGLVGSGLFGRMNHKGVSVQATSRREPLKPGFLNFDVLRDDYRRLEEMRPRAVFMCAAVTSLQACEDNPEFSYQVNVASTVELVRGLLRCEAFVVFLSSNTVFDGEVPRPTEGAPYRPLNAYGRQKVAAEEQLLGLSGASSHLAIVRLSKILSPASGIPRQFIANLRAGKSCRAFSDLSLSPNSLAYVTQALCTIAEARESGVFHLSGEAELSYADLARQIALRLGADTSLIQAVASADAGESVLFKPRHPGLGMRHTTERLGISPEPFCAVLDSLLAPPH